MRKLWVCLLAAVLLCACLPMAYAAETEGRMVASQALIDKMKAREGFSATPYWDYAHYSIGYGTTCPEELVSYYEQFPMSEALAETEFKKHLGEFEEAVRAFAQKHSLTLAQHQFDALVSFSYNCGAGWMDSLSGYFNTAVRQGDTGAALLYGMSLYSTAGGQYLLIGRRLWEANMYINGDYGEGEKGNYPDNYRWVFLEGNGGKVRYKICAFDTHYQAALPEAFGEIPLGKDEQGNTFVYDFAGWYTADGEQVTRLDSSLVRGQTLYARWTDPQGNFRPDETVPQFPQTAVVKTDCNTRKGPGSETYGKSGKLLKGQTVTVTEERYGNTVSGQTVWCKVGKNKWVTKAYLEYTFSTQTDLPADNGGTALKSLKKIKNPAQTQFVQPILSPDWEGSVVLATYQNGYQKAFTVTRAMVENFNGAKLGKQTVTAKVEGKAVKFSVSVSRLKSPGQLTGAAIEDNAALLSWEPGENATDYYVYYRKDGDTRFTLAGTTAALSYEIPALERNARYQFRVVSYRLEEGYAKQGPGAETALFINDKMDAPGDLVAEATGETAVQLSWKAASGATHYQVLYKAENAKEYTSAGMTQELNFAISDLSINTRYDFKVVSYLIGEAQEEGPQTRPVSVFLHPTLGAATGLTAEQTAHDTAALTWQPGENATFYQVQYQLPTDETYTTLGETEGLTYEATLPRVNVTYRFRVVSCYAYGSNRATGPAGGETSLDTAPITAAPRHLQAARSGNGAVKLTWEAAGGTTDYYVYYRRSGDTAFTKAGKTPELTYTVGDLDPTEAYDFRVHSYYQDDTGSYKGPMAETALTLSLQVAAPTDLTATLTDHDDVQLTWTAADGASHYYVYYRKAGKEAFTKAGETDGLSYTVENLANNKPYEFRVIGYFKNGTGAYKGAGTEPVSCATTRELFAPLLLRLKCSNSGTVQISWSRAWGATAYAVYLKRDGDSGYTLLGHYAGTAAEQTGLTGGSYTCKVVPCTTVNGGYYEDDSAKTATVTIK
ncbi:MAG: fibronectin type III domain-containing protein [Oscillospiraceae bacterium]|nr:fibronectin type III domain-containing protein [Oscillospiraceae bacterium]